MIESAQILLIDEDELLQELIETVLYLHNPAYQLYKARSLNQASDLLEQTKFDLVITEVEFSSGIIFEDVAQFVMDVHNRLPAPAVLALTCGTLIKDGVRLHVDAWLPKPPAVDTLLEKVDNLINSTRESVLRGVSLNSFLQVLAHETKSCTVSVRSGEKTGKLFFELGTLIHAETDDEAATGAALQILSWTHCVVRIGTITEAPHTIHKTLTSLLMEAAMSRDLATQ